MRRLLIRVLLALIALAAFTYACDGLVLRYRLAKNQGYGTVTVQRYYAIRQKTGKTEYSTADPEDVICVRSIFPHNGNAPCWYVARHPEKEINI